MFCSICILTKHIIMHLYGIYVIVRSVHIRILKEMEVGVEREGEGRKGECGREEMRGREREGVGERGGGGERERVGKGRKNENSLRE